MFARRAVLVLVVATAVSHAARPAFAQSPTFTSVSAGGTHTCALDTTGAIWCWGENGNAQAGGRGPDRCDLLLDGFHDVPCAKRPRRVPGDQQWTMVSAGGRHTCALDADGRAWCWGDNRWFATGAPATEHCESPDRRGTNHCHLVPVKVVTESTFTTISAGYQHTCALTPGGTAMCWGMGGPGVLGEGFLDEERLMGATEVANVPPLLALAPGTAFTAALDSSGQVWAWGQRDYGMVFDGVRLAVELPHRVAIDWTFRSIAAGARGMCGITTDGDFLCWGVLPSRFDADLRGDPPQPTRVPVPMESWTGRTMTDQQRQAWRFVTVAVGWRHACGLDGARRAWCWGAYGAPGFGPFGAFVVSPTVIAPSLQPVPVPETLQFTSLSAGMAHACGVSNGAVYCWGVGLSGQLGQGRDEGSATPVKAKPK
jgi:alpha-tubulin suppressor-like RCC1 family protein